MRLFLTRIWYKTHFMTGRKLLNLKPMKNFYYKILAGGAKIIVLIFLLNSCAQDPLLWDIKSNEQVISEYLSSNPTRFSEFAKLVESVGLDNLLSTRGPFTLFLPTNDAVKKFYQDNGMNGIEQFTDKKLRTMFVYNHLVANEISTSDIGLGAIRDTNAIGDYLVTEFRGSDIIVNKKSVISKRDVRAANGYIQIIDRVIDPVTISAFDVLANNPSYSIFAEGLRRTGLKDTLQLISFPYGKKNARTRFTIFAVADTTYNRFGVKSITDLINKYTNRPDSVKFLKNGFYRYMEYHCLGGTYYLSAFDTRLYPILSYDNNISVTIEDDYKLNLNRITGKYTGFNIEQSNIPAKNGAIHTVRDMLPVVDPEPSYFEFEVTDYFDMRQGDYFGKYYMKWSDGQNTFAKIKWSGDYLQYYYKNHNTGELKNWDCLNMNGFWWIEITTPKIMKGNYRLSGNIWANQVDYEVYVDGVKTALIKRTDSGRPALGEFKWTKTEEHKVKLVAVSWGLLFWDTLTFTPIN